MAATMAHRTGGSASKEIAGCVACNNFLIQPDYESLVGHHF